MKDNFQKYLDSLPTPTPGFLALLNEYADPKDAEAERIVRHYQKTGVLLPRRESPDFSTTD